MPLFGRGKSGGSLIDRDPQNLPMPVGGFRVVRKNRRTSTTVKWWRSTAPNMVASVGLIAALIGAYLGATREATPVGSNGGSIYVAGLQLQETPPHSHLYIGNAAMVYLPRPDGSYVGAASTYSEGKNVAGLCVLVPHVDEIDETCKFWIGAAITAAPSFTSTDTYDLSSSSAVWKRHYSDGVNVNIVVPSGSGVVAVPLPVGR